MQICLITRCLRILIAMLFVSACASPPDFVSLSTQAYDQQDLLDGHILDIPPEQFMPSADILAVNDDMRAFLTERVPSAGNRKQKVEAILRAMLDDGLRLDYNLFHTLTAEEAFYAREGNCMSFTNLFVALARESGITTTYQEVEVPPSWGSREDTWLFNKHLNAVVDLPGGSMMVDFSMESFDNHYRRNTLDDTEALARYHNNMGVHLMMDKELDAAFAHFRNAINLAPGTGYFWTNLGSLYRRSGEVLAAEAAYLEAIEISRDTAAMSNLARLYRSQGREELANWYETKVELFRSNNPYYLHLLAQQAFDDGNYELSVSRSKSALRVDDQRHEVHRLLGMAYIRLGRPEDATEAFASAALLADNDEQAAIYSKKIRMLARQ